MDPLGGDAEDLVAPTINAKNVDGEPPGRLCRRSESAHHQRKKRRRRAPVGGSVSIRNPKGVL
jgi:hypothetical protein